MRERQRQTERERDRDRQRETERERCFDTLLLQTMMLNNEIEPINSKPFCALAIRHRVS